MIGWQQALQNAMGTHAWPVGMCDNFTANMYGYQASGYNTALDHWNAIPGASQHPGDQNAPAGALMFWGGNQDGHVAISDGSGGIFSTDIGGQGTVSHVPSSEITSKWGLQYLGWTPPIFQGSAPGAVGGNSGVVQAFSLNPFDYIGGATGALGDVTGASTFLNFLTGSSGFGIDVKDMAERAGLIILGGVLVLIALYRISGVGGAVNNAVQSGGKSGSLVPSGEHSNG